MAHNENRVLRGFKKRWSKEKSPEVAFAEGRKKGRAKGSREIVIEMGSFKCEASVCAQLEMLLKHFPDRQAIEWTGAIVANSPRKEEMEDFVQILAEEMKKSENPLATPLLRFMSGYLLPDRLPGADVPEFEASGISRNSWSSGQTRFPTYSGMQATRGAAARASRPF